MIEVPHTDRQPPASLPSWRSLTGALINNNSKQTKKQLIETNERSAK